MACAHWISATLPSQSTCGSAGGAGAWVDGQWKDGQWKDGRAS